jgi:EXS family
MELLIVNILHHSRDQLCSLAFSLSNSYFVACSYARGFHSNSIHKCGNPALWAIPLVLGVLPFVARFAQSIRRWWDSQLFTHLINVRPSLFLCGVIELNQVILREASTSRGSCITCVTIYGDITVCNSS